MFFIGLDIGTTSICGVLYDTLHDKVVRELHGENHFLEGAGFRQDPEEIVAAARRILEGLLEDVCQQGAESRPGGGEQSVRRIGGIGISAQMHGILYVNQEGNAVSPYYTWKNEWSGEHYRTDRDVLICRLWQRDPFLSAKEWTDSRGSGVLCKHRRLSGNETDR